MRTRMRRSRKTGTSKRPVIKITAEDIHIWAFITDVAILFVLIAWWIWEVRG